MHNSLVDELNRRKLSIAHLLKSYAFNRPIDLLHQFSQRTDELGRSLSMLRSHKLAMITSQLTSLQQRLAALDPGLALKRGYALVYKDGHIVASRQDVARGDAVDIRFHDGTAQSTIS